ncbi:hypothetical protein BCR44DRAFT_1498042 [Catenaria anguillulae PL171]|uniref:Uncharacterized protein n=1 Tax=Catenaria anguillulae PL171 TaxID=765915 RepID=A0A1Y2HSN3_9FUNG|nr:hypothetical protein BCR44DRAFT_1498042 [Catenaria anguillulae PL171]
MGADLSKYESYSLVSYASNPFAILDAAYVHDGLKPLHLTLVPDTRLLSTGEWKIHTGSSADNLLYTTRTNFGRGEVDRATVTVLDSAQGGKPVCTTPSTTGSSEAWRGHGRQVRAIKGELELQVTIKGSGEVVWVKTTKRGNMIYVFSGYPQLDKEGRNPEAGT